MKFTFTVFFLLLSGLASVFAQNSYSVKGVVADTASKVKLPNTSVCVLNAKDSVLVRFTRVGADGTFALNNLKKGKYLLLVTYPNYADYVDRFTLDSANQTHDFGKINMLLKSKLLADVIIKAKVAAVKIKGDTTEFNAGSFVVQPNAKVEDLLKQLPGIQVDKDGKITAQGQTVNKVLVDGEEFFGDDPTLVTKNIRADMVDKVQLYDKKSDQATFTGIDDGVKDKTINIKLKEDKKNGYFGKAVASGGTDGYYEEQAMFNRFKGKQKFSFYGITANTGKTGLGWEDADKYGASSNNVQFTDDGGIFITSNGDDLESFDGRYNGQGIPQARTGGVHYDTKWNADKETINANYKTGYLAVDGTKNTQTQNNLPTGLINSNADQTYNNSVFRQKLDFTYNVKMDTTATMKIAVDGTTKNNKTNNSNQSTSTRGDNTLLNSNSRTLSNNSDQDVFNASVLWTKKLKKKGRTMSLNVSEAYSHSDAKGYLNSSTRYFDTTGVLKRTDLINQYKTNDIHSSVLNSNFTYTEPFSKVFSLITNYGLGINNSGSDRKSFNASAPGVYNLLDDTLSNNFKLNQLTNQIGGIFNYVKGKTIFNFGTKITHVDFNQVDAITNITLKRTFINWSPQATYQYKFSQQQSVRFSYQGNTSQPNINQIQPIRVNTDPLNITLGNPDLKPSFSNNLNVNYNSYKVLSGQSVYGFASFSFTNNQIVSNVTTDVATGKSTIQSLNLSGKMPFNYYAYASMGRKIKPVDITVNLNLNLNGSRSFSYVNNALNTTNTITYSANVGMYKYVEKKYDMNLSFGPNYTKSQSSLQPNINNNGLGANGYANFGFYLPGKLEISSDANYTFRGKTQTFNEDFSRVIINSSLSKKFLKGDGLKLSASVNDLLNQNQGFNRSASGNYITQTSYTTIKRYFMLSLAWDFSKMGPTAAKK